MLRINLAYFDSHRDYNGVAFAMPKYSDFLRFKYVDKEDLSNGWSSTDTQYNFMDFWSETYTIDNNTYKKGINVYAPMYVNGNGILFNNGNTVHTSDIIPLTWNGVDSMLGICGDNGLFLGYKNSYTYQARIALTESAHAGTTDHIRSWGNWNLSGYTIHNGTFSGAFTNTYANTDTNTAAMVSALETNNSDNIRYIYKNIKTVNNKIILNIPNEYVGREYTIIGIVKKSFGDYAITSEEETRFVIETDREMTLNIEISIV